MSRFQDVKKAYAEARKKYDGYYSQCAYFAGAFSRALVDGFGWPRELVTWERPGAGPVAHVEDALVLEEDTYWHLGLLLRLYEEIATHYDRGLDLFLENRAAKLRLPFSPPEPKPLPDTGEPESER